MCQHHPQCAKLRTTLKQARVDGPGSTSYTKAVELLLRLVRTVFGKVYSRPIQASAEGVAPHLHDLESMVGDAIASFMDRKLIEMTLADDCFLAYFNKIARSRDYQKEVHREEVSKTICEITPLGVRTRVRVPHHGLTGGETLKIEGTHSEPSIDGEKYVSEHRQQGPVNCKGFYAIVDRHSIDLLVETIHGGDSGMITFRQRSLDTSITTPASNDEAVSFDPADHSGSEWRSNLWNHLRSKVPPMDDADWSAYHSYYPKRSTGRSPDEAAAFVQMDRPEFDGHLERAIRHVMLSLAIAAHAEHREPQWTEIANHLEIDKDTAKQIFQQVMRKSLEDFLAPPGFPRM